MQIRLKELPTENVIRELAGKYPEMSIPAVTAVTRLFWVTGEMEKSCDHFLSKHGISFSRFLVLMVLRRYAPEGLKATELADKISVTRGNMTGLVDGLEKSGYIRKEACPNDRRSVFIRLSDKGNRFLERILPEHFRRMTQMMSLVSGPELHKMAMNLEKIREGIERIQENA